MVIAGRRFGRILATGVGIAALALVTVSPASAHVDMTPDTTSAGSRAELEFSFSHGCDGSSTTGIAIQIPEEFNAVTPVINHGWDAGMVTEELDEPITDSHGNEVTERVSEVVYTAKEPVQDGFQDSLTLIVTLPEDAAGETIYFPTVQTCEAGETAWIQIPEEGQDAEELDSPAPAITVTEASEATPHAMRGEQR